MAALELALDPADAARLPRLPEVWRHRAGRGRTAAVELVWYDTPDGALAGAGLSLCERRVGRETAWRLERLCGVAEAPWPPGAPAPLVAEAPQPAGLPDLPAPLLPVAAFSGTQRSFPTVVEAALGIALLRGTLRAVAGERPACRLLLTGSPEQLQPLVLELAGAVRLHVPAAALAAEAHEVAGRTVPPRAMGAPELPPHLPVVDAFSTVAGHLGCVLLHWAPLAAADGPPEAVHQMRVALRRLRSAASLFRRAVGGPELDAVNADLGALTRVLGPARDWDVFAAGTGHAVGASFADDRAVASLLAAAERQRRAAYAALRAYLDGPAFRLLGMRLACLAAFRPWERAAAPDPSDEAAAKQAALRAAPLTEFAAHALTRRLERVLEAGDDLAGLPLEALHASRIQGKRLRYAAEFFAPLYPRKETRRFLRRIAALQERLGHLNDSAVAEALMRELGGSGAQRAMAVGIVRGFVAAGLGRARARSERSWRKLRRLEPFWS